MISLPLLDYPLITKVSDGKTQIFDIIRKAWVVMTPEEHVRQRLVHHLVHGLRYPSSLIAIEKQIIIGTVVRRFDLVVYDRNEHQPWMLAECKAPEVTITQRTLEQLLHYHLVLQCRYWMLTNGHQNFCADAGDACAVTWMDQLPAYEP